MVVFYEITVYGNNKKPFRFPEGFSSCAEEKLLGSEQFVRLGFFVGSAVGVDGTGLDRFVQTAAELAGEFGGGGISGGDSGAKFLFNGFELADAGAVAKVRLLAGAKTLDSRFGVSHD